MVFGGATSPTVDERFQLELIREALIDHCVQLSYDEEQAQVLPFPPASVNATPR